MLVSRRAKEPLSWNGNIEHRVTSQSTVRLVSVSSDYIARRICPCNKFLMAGTTGGPGSRGRPPRSPQPSARPGSVPQQDRPAWLLRVNRLYGFRDDWTTAARFARRFRGGCWGEETTASRISRWETGAVRAPHRALQRYEQLLELPNGSLVAVTDTVYRYSAPTIAAPPRLDRGPRQSGRTELLLEQALTNDIMTGSDWDQLTADLAVAPRVVAPASLWERLAERLLAETIIADGVPWMQRYEALSRLLAHPIGQRAAVAACASLAADHSNQIFVEPLSVLDASAHPDAGNHLLRQLVDPTNELARYGALLGCVRKLRYRHFTGPQLHRLVPVVNALLEDPAARKDVQPLAVELMRHLPADLLIDRRTELNRAISGDRLLRRVFKAGRLMERETARVTVARIVRSTLAGLFRELPHFRDQMLPMLVDEMLFHPVLDIRLYAAMLLAATPYREPLAAALATELTAVPHATETTQAMLEALRILGGQEQRPLVERLITATGVRPPVVVAAARAIGHMRGRSSDRFWVRAITHHVTPAPAAVGGPHHLALSGLVYALGLARDQRMLRMVASHPAVPAGPRAAAVWWLGRPAYVLDSAAR